MADLADIAISPSRRTLLKTGAAAGTFLFAFHLPIAQAAAAKDFEPNAFIRIARDGKITLVMPQVEMGQGVYTSIPMIIAEELDAAWEMVSVIAAPPDEKLYANPVLQVQATGNSNSVRAFWMPLRKAGSITRAMLINAAAKQWKVDPASCSAKNSEVIHTASGRKLSYGALIDAASKETPPTNPPLKDPKDFSLVGRPLKRLDTPDKVNGKAVYGIDVLPPGVKFATLMASPVFGGKVGHVDDTEAKKIPGVRQIVVLDDLVAVVGDHFWAAKQGLDALDIVWNDGANANVDSAQVWRQIKASGEKPGLVARAAGDAQKALKDGEKYDARYELPFLAHAPMEPMNCVVHVQPDSCEIWVGSQVCGRTQAIAAKVTGLPLEKVTVHNMLLGGGFGRRLEVDATERCVRVAQKVDGPVKVIYTREEDIRQDMYRPVYYDQLSATLKDGRIDGWHHRIAGSSVVARWLPPAFTGNHNIDFDAVDSAIDIPYDIPNLRIEYVRDEPPAVPTGFWRGVGPNNNVFAVESFIEELALKAGKDRVAFRLSMLDKKPRLKNAVQLAAEKSGWNAPLGSRIGRGMTAQVSFASFIATVIEVEVDDEGEVHLRRITSAVDTGIAVNPDTVIAQLQGGIIFGLTAALYGEITIDKGRVQQSNFHDYRMLRINQVPSIDAHLIKSGEAPGGIGETGSTTGPPALVNAIAAATGVRLRRLPIDRNLLAVGKKA
ncbi:MAG TPA: molybdopterin cofactor-binding domain-containing protein [Rhizomicrobium sp.]|jgi:isoquinoline 1-oxidoreductase beta subunit